MLYTIKSDNVKCMSPEMLFNLLKSMEKVQFSIAEKER